MFLSNMFWQLYIFEFLFAVQTLSNWLRTYFIMFTELIQWNLTSTTSRTVTCHMLKDWNKKRRLFDSAIVFEAFGTGNSTSDTYLTHDSLATLTDKRFVSYFFTMSTSKCSIYINKCLTSLHIFEILYYYIKNSIVDGKTNKEKNR